VKDSICLALELAVKQAQRSELDALVRDLVASARGEEGTLRYEVSASDDGSTYHIIEEYRDASALAQHLGTFQTVFASRVMALLEPKGVTVYGDLDTQTRKQLAMMHPTFMMPVAVFRRAGASVDR
jgi:quinol monooxygenase YgiN